MVAEEADFILKVEIFSKFFTFLESRAVANEPELPVGEVFEGIEVLDKLSVALAGAEVLKGEEDFGLGGNSVLGAELGA